MDPVQGSSHCIFDLKMKMKRERSSGCRRMIPFSFSSFGRSVAHATYINTRDCGTSNSRFGKESKVAPINSTHIRVVGDEDSGQSDCSDAEVDGVIVNADFAFFDPKPEDFGGVKNLLQSFLLGEKWNLSGFVNLVLGQTTVGTVVKVEGEEDGVFGVITALNLGRYKQNTSILEIKEYLLKVCNDKNVLENIRVLLGDQDSDVGLLVSQRVTNFPPQLIPPLYDALFDEISWATEDEPEELRKYFDFKYYIICSSIYKKKGSRGQNDNTVVYVKPEDEIFIKLSTWHFSFPLQRQMHLGFDGFHLMGLVMIVEMSKVSSFRRNLKSLVDEC